MEYEIYKDGELYHWGVRGMRWGVRRYQNKDGSLTDRGKKRLRAEQAKVRQEEQVLKNRKAVKSKLDRLDARRKAVEEGKKELDGEDVKTGLKGKKGKKTSEADKETKKSIADMTDDELLRAVNRSRLEEQYRQLNPEPPVKKSLMTRMKDEVVVPAAISSGKRMLENSLNKLGEKILEGKIDPNSVEALKKMHEKLDLQQKIDKIRNPDKYLSEEDKTKRRDREIKDEDRAAKMEGYADAVDKAAKRREADEAARKAAANEAARKANESKSQDYYNSTYNTSKVKYRTEYVNTGKSEVSSSLKALPSSVSNLPAKTVNSGKTRVAGLLDGPVTRPKSEEKYATYDEDGKFIGYWSGIRGDSDVII